MGRNQRQAGAAVSKANSASAQWRCPPTGTMCLRKEAADCNCGTLRLVSGYFGPTIPCTLLPPQSHPDGLLVLAASDPFNAVHLWNIATSEEVLRLEAHSLTITSVACSPDDRYILTGSLDRTARLWDRKSGIKIRSFESDSEVDSVAFSPDGRFVVTGHEYKTARLWDLTSGKEIRPFEGHTAPIYSAAFSPDGRFVLTGGVDETARLWDPTNGREVRRFESQSAYYWFGAFSLDARYLITAGVDRMGPSPKADIWDIETGKALASLIHSRTGVGQQLICRVVTMLLIRTILPHFIGSPITCAPSG